MTQPINFQMPYASPLENMCACRKSTQLWFQFLFVFPSSVFHIFSSFCTTNLPL